MDNATVPRSVLGLRPTDFQDMPSPRHVDMAVQALSVRRDSPVALFFSPKMFRRVFRLILQLVRPLTLGSAP
jgi:hypothetical protein